MAMASGLGRLSLAVVILLVALTARPAPAAELTDDEIETFSFALLFGEAEARAGATRALTQRGRLDVTAVFILALRVTQVEDERYAAALRTLSGFRGTTWFDWMLWQEKHPEVRPHPSFARVLIALMTLIDARFEGFLVPYLHAPGAQKIRLEEIAWGGVPVDGIPPLDRPKRIAAAAADYLAADDLVFGIEIAGDARAYPLRIMGWHEMLNDVVGGQPLSLAYCTLCGAGILYEARVPGHDKAFEFSSSGLLYRSNKLMYDRKTRSLWNQFTGEPVSGALRDSGIQLRQRPLAITTWSDWRARHPATTVLSLDTGHRRDYGSGVVYRDYFASPSLMFPAAVDESRLKQKDQVFAMTEVGARRAWPLAAFAGGQRFARSGDAAVVVGADGRNWRIGKDALFGPGGERLPRLAGHLAYWFAWDNYFGAQGTLYPEPAR